MVWQQRNDSVAGYIYLLKAKDFHGWIPGCYLSRVKIGLSRDVDRRLEALHSNQPPTDLEVVKVIAVKDMASVEAELHRVFKSQNVKLLKSREYFDLNPMQVQRCIWLMNQADIKRTRNPISMKAVAGGLIALLGVGMLIGHSFENPASQKIQHQKARSFR